MNWKVPVTALCGALSFGTAFAQGPTAPSPDAPPAPPAAPPPPPAVTITWGGYVKFDALYSRFSEGEVAQGTSRDFYVPGTIPVESATSESHDTLDFHAKETRLFVKAATQLENGDKVGAHVEFDFISGQYGGTEVVTNAYNPALRRAFLTYNNWTVGQDWSTFVNLGALPETLDFVTFPSDGTVFSRQPLVRNTNGALQVSLENAETTVLPNGGVTPTNPVATTGDARLPDVVARVEFGGLALAAIVRQLAIDNDAAAGGLPIIDDQTVGFGVSFSGKVPLGADDLRFMVTTGDGVGRYLALGTSTDAVVDAGGQLEAIGVTNGYLAYRHAWSGQWRSTLALSTLQVDNDAALTGTGVTKSVETAAVNLLYSPTPKVTVGVELRHATRETEAGAEGDLDRLQFATKYTF